MPRNERKVLILQATTPNTILLNNNTAIFNAVASSDNKQTSSMPNSKTGSAKPRLSGLGLLEDKRLGRAQEVFNILSLHKRESRSRR